VAKCITVQRKDTHICVGSLNKKISIFERTLTASSDPDVLDYEEVFTEVSTPWAMLETIKGEVIFDNVSIDRIATHNFYIRYDASITQENWIVFNNNHYDILNVENLDENFRFLRLESVIRGDVAKDATKA
jgi:SPP1 family predicted phage head-tail adaptor